MEKMDNQLRIPMICHSSEFGKLERQVSWAAIPGCKLQKSDLKLKGQSEPFDRNHATLAKWGMSRRRLCLVLTDVLKTDVGKSFLDKRQARACGKKVPTTSERSLCKKEAVSCRGQKPPKNETAVLKSVKRSTPSSLQRLSLRKRLHYVDDGEERKDLQPPHEEDYRVVDCGLSVSWKPAEDAGDADEFSPTRMKDVGTQEKHCLKKRKKLGRRSRCNGTSGPKRQRESVLRLTGESKRDGGLAPPSLVEPGEDCDADDTDGELVQFGRAARLVPVANSNYSEAADVAGSPGRIRSPAQEDASQAVPGEPIVLSSDEEEGGDFIQRRVCTVFPMGDAGAGHRGPQDTQEIAPKELGSPDLKNVEVLHVVVGERGSTSSVPKIDCSVLGVAFTSFFCGGYQGDANGNLVIVNQKIIIPLKDSDQESDVTLTLERTELRRYSIWEPEDLESRGLCWASDVEPCTVLLFCVTQRAAVAIHRDLLHMSAQHGALPDTGNPSPFLTLTLKDPLVGTKGVVLRSLLEIDCLNSLTSENHEDPLDLKDFISPDLSLDESLELIRSTDRDPFLLQRLGLDADEPDRWSSTSDSDVDALNAGAERALLLDMCELESLFDLDQGTTTEQEQEQEEVAEDAGMQHSPGEEPSNQEEDEHADTPLYTLCRRRTAGKYTVTMCQPDSNWVKYKHQGLAHRLIQFPPPPLKGGITVTMEDLQCLDSGQYLNDVIIDFYLKYLLHNSPRAVVERSHIFSSFFYKQLTRRDNASEGNATESCQRQKRHQRVKTWTRHVDIFKKDFLFVPVNQEAHWYLVVICFPGLEESTSEPRTEGHHNGTDEPPEQEQPGSSGEAAAPPKLNRSDSADASSGKEPTKASHTQVYCTEKTCHRNVVSKRPCILVMDSLKLSLHERIFKVLREYLQSEWEARRGSWRDFGPDQMKSSHCQVPLQDNSSDCGLYLLQYVESFLKDPVVHFDLPLHLQRWFPRRQVRRKREEIRDLVLQLYRQQKMSKK
ncbi:sentrin-specific protease 7 isoform X2 [Syngnathoides biaculeatus]|uniref:sentrin-specific protease 7 isoform X2 n=1 Tax=Syngnathoides biaculeatus TaxID=300417 RepID=UPI002ADDCF09|nr:sentrin-specific protease 7 isoform X2 [Syngnathoides biaculeatus]